MLEKAEYLRKRIFTALLQEHFLSDVIVNIVCSDARDYNDCLQPFLRVYITPGPDVDRVMELLDQHFDMDVEGPIDIKFRPRKSARNKQSI